jgi:hypothetical protein
MLMGMSGKIVTWLFEVIGTNNCKWAVAITNFKMISL